MNNIEPNPISEYYIAYFDILGYKDFFKKTPENERQFLNAINDAIQRVKEDVKTFNGSELIGFVAKTEIKIKIFSDNFLLCVEVGTNVEREKARLLAFMFIVSEIQRNFIIQYGLFVRGGITKGRLSFNDDYVFGDGLIEAVEMEQDTRHPRIAISGNICEYMNSVQMYSKEDVQRAEAIVNKLLVGDSISEEDKKFQSEIDRLMGLEYLAATIWTVIGFRCADDVMCLSYLYCLDIRSFISEELVKELPSLIRQIAPNDNHLPLPFPDIDRVLGLHQTIVETKLMEHNIYISLDTANVKDFDIQESILRKYIWSMYYHNKMCELYNKPQYHIYTIANCENRHMKLTVFVVDKDNKIKTDLVKSEIEQPNV